jgi:arylsulfatase A-like enzyme
MAARWWTLGSFGTVLVASAALAAGGGSPATHAGPSRPRLLVLISLDQFGSFYLEEYGALFDKGFARLRREGRTYPRAEVAHAPTLTWPGHASLSTGAYPGHHGISSHRVFWTWPEKDDYGHMPTLDPGERVPGFPDAAAFSGRDLRVTALADWVRAADPRARSVAIAQAYGGIAAMLGGRTRDAGGRSHAYWLLPGEPAYVTSTFYEPELPAWVDRFDAETLPGLLAAESWELVVPPGARDHARRDAADYEGDGRHVRFPHRFEAEVPGVVAMGPELRERQRRLWLARTPLVDEATFALAHAALGALDLGRDEATDLLAIAVKSTDRIGHDYGPRSLEQLDVLFRLDRELGALFDRLDREVGRGRWALVLSADHGAPFVPEAERESGRPGRRIAAEEMEALLGRVDALVRADHGDRDALRRRVVQELQASDFIERAWTPEDLTASGPADALTRAYRHSYVPGQVWSYPLWTRDELATGRLGENHPAHLGIVAELTENTDLWTARSTHGSAWAYDREVPLVLLGPGVSPGVATGPARTVDVAPTLAAWAGIAVPPSVDGRPLPLSDDTGPARGAGPAPGGGPSRQGDAEHGGDTCRATR